MKSSDTVRFETDRALVEAMLLVGEPLAVIEDFLSCLGRSDEELDQLRQVARSERDPDAAPTNGLSAADLASGDVLEMNPLTSQPQRSRPR